MGATVALHWPFPSQQHPPASCAEVSSVQEASPTGPRLHAEIAESLTVRHARTYYLLNAKQQTHSMPFANNILICWLGLPFLNKGLSYIK